MLGNAKVKVSVDWTKMDEAITKAVDKRLEEDRKKKTLTKTVERECTKKSL